MACRPNARSLAVSQGKGLDRDAARASALMEAIELYHAERIASPLKLSSWNELRFSHSLAAIELLPRISISTFHSNHPILWIEGVDIFGSKSIWLPFELVHTNYTLPLPTGSGCFVMTSNGLASGNHSLEAISHGLCEVVERDAISLFRFGSLDNQDRMRVDLRTIRDHNCKRLLELYRVAGIEVGVWDATSNIGIATYRCVVVDGNSDAFPQSGPIEGLGCHPVREVALLRALTEAAQARLTLIAGSRDDNGRSRYLDVFDPRLAKRARDRLSGNAARPFEATITYENETFEEDVQLILHRLQLAGLTQAIVVDLTKPEFGIPVVRVVVPGLETYHHVQGYVPGERALRILKAQAAKAQQ